MMHANIFFDFSSSDIVADIEWLGLPPSKPLNYVKDFLFIHFT